MAEKRLSSTTLESKANEVNEGIILSMTGVAEAGIRLSLILNGIACRINNATSESLALSRNITLFASLLKQVAEVLQDGEPVHSAEAVRAAEQVVTESNTIFEEIDSMLAKVSAKKDEGEEGLTVQQKFRWIFKKAQVEYLLAQLDSLKMSLSLMLQILQLGATMAATSRNDTQEKFESMMSKVKKERVEAQNMVMVTYFQDREVADKYDAAKRELNGPLSPIDYKRESDDLSLTRTSTEVTIIEDAPRTAEPLSLIKSPKGTVTELRTQFTEMNRATDDLVNMSEKVTHNLVDRWTDWRRVREEHDVHTNRRGRNSKYSPMVQDFDEDETSLYNSTLNRNDSQHHKYLEGPTEDWRQPHSVQAKQQRAQLRRVYSGYQPSVSADSSEQDDSPRSNGSLKKPSRRHAINSDSETSEEDEKPQRRRRMSGSAQANEKRSRQPDGAPLQKSYTTTSYVPQPAPQPPAPTPRGLAPPFSAQPSRPYPSPDQQHHHATSSPAGKLNTQYHPPAGDLRPPQPNPYISQPYSGSTYPPPGQQSSRYINRISPQGSRPQTQRPVSREGYPPRSPSRLSQQYPTPGYPVRQPEYASYPSGRRQHRWEDEEAHRKQTKKKLGDRAAKGLLAGGGIAVLLEALDAI